MHGHIPGTNTVLLIPKMIGLLLMNILPGVHMAHSIIHWYVHFNISVIRLVVITEVI